MDAVVYELTNTPEMRDRLTERIQHVIVDVYQDVHPIQEAIKLRGRQHAVSTVPAGKPGRREVLQRMRHAATGVLCLLSDNEPPQCQILSRVWHIACCLYIVPQCYTARSATRCSRGPVCSATSPVTVCCHS